MADAWHGYVVTRGDTVSVSCSSIEAALLISVVQHVVSRSGGIAWHSHTAAHRLQLDLRSAHRQASFAAAKRLGTAVGVQLEEALAVEEGLLLEDRRLSVECGSSLAAACAGSYD